MLKTLLKLIPAGSYAGFVGAFLALLGLLGLGEVADVISTLLDAYCTSDRPPSIEGWTLPPPAPFG